MKKTTHKRGLALLLSLMLLLSMLPTTAFAEGGNTIYTQSTYAGADSDGTASKPFKTFDAALKKAKEQGGGTIVILEKAYQNDTVGGSNGNGMPLVIDTPVTIKGQSATGKASFQIRSGGIVLGANVTIENVELSFENWMHNAIFVNGHKFTATNVTRASGSREVHLFGGELKGITTATSGSAAVLTLTNSTFGNIYAGSMSQYSDTTAAAYNGNTTVSLTNCTVGSIYGSGARAAHDPDNFIDTNEPAPPIPGKDHTVSGTVNVSMDGSSKVGTAPTITVNGNGTTDVSVTISSASENKPLNLSGVSSLTVNGGTAAVAAINETADVTLNNNATINLYAVASANNAATIASLSGNGTVAIGNQATLTIGTVNGQHILKTVDSSSIQSLAVFGHSYIIQNSGSGSFALDDGSKINSDMELTWDADGKTWKTPDVQSKTYLEELKIDPDSKNITKTVKEINHEIIGGAEIKVLIGNDDELQNVPLTITVNGQKATFEDDSYVVGNMRLTAIDEWDNQFTSGVASISIGKKDNNSTIAAGTYEITVTAPTANSTVSDTFTLTVTDGEGTKPQPIEGIHDLFEPKDSSKQEKFLARVMNRMLYLDQEIDVSDIDISAEEIKYISSAGVPMTGAYAARYLIVENPFHSTVSLQYGSYPEFTYKDNGNVATVKVQYSTSWNLDLVKRAIAGYDEAMSLIQPNDGDFAKILKFHDWIVKNVSYGMRAGLEGYAVGAFANRSVVCGGYTDCYKFLLDQVGIKNIRVNAMTSTEQHAWNLVLFDGHYFHVDTTWDRGPVGSTGIRHSYFMVNDAEFNENGVHTDKWKAGNYPQGNTCSIENKFYQNNTDIATDEQISENPIRIKHQYPADAKFQTSETEHWANCAGGTEIREAHNGQTCSVCGYTSQPQPVEKTLSNIAITTPPTKTAYTVGDTFDSTGMVVTATYSDGTRATVTGFTYTPDGALAVNDTSITISYTENGVTKTTTQTISIQKKPPVLASLEISGLETVEIPGTANYSVTGKDADGQDFDLSETAHIWSIQNDPAGVSISNKGTLTVTEDAAPGKIVIQVSAGNIFATKTVQLAKPVTPEITLSAAPSKPISYGDTFTLTASVKNGEENGQFLWKSSDGDVLEVIGNGETVTVKALKTGNAAISVTYGVTKASTSDIHVTPCAITARADDKRMTAGEALPVLTVSYSGILDSDAADAIFEKEAVASVATDGQTAGTFDITVTAPTLKSEWADKYEIGKIENGTLTVDQKQEPGKPDPEKPDPKPEPKPEPEKPAKKDQSALVLSVNKTHLAVGDVLTLSAVGGSTSGNAVYKVSGNGSVSITGNTLTATKAGTVTITAIKAGDETYNEVASNSVTITITNSAQSGGSGSTGGNSGGSGGGSGGGGATESTFKVVVNKVDNGTVSLTPDNAAKGSTVTITVKPDKGYKLDKITVTDKGGNRLSLSDKGDGKYTFTMSDGKVSVDALFSKIAASVSFLDVNQSDYYYDAVQWAVEKGITEGTSATTFSPGASCTRAQMVAFLYRAAGSPAPKSTVNPFTDVTANDYYYNAVLWAVENGITTGVSADRFAPGVTVSRAQTVTFLYRANGSPAANGAGFSDVAADEYYANAVAWAVRSGITTGTGNGKFAPNAPCTRGQIVTFLYRSSK